MRLDRTSRIGVGVCLLILLYLVYYDSTHAPKYHPKPADKTTTPLAATVASATTTQAVTKNLAQAPTPAPTSASSVAEQLTFLENDDLKLTLTSQGAAIKEIELKKQKEDKGGHVVLNEQARTNILQLTGWQGADTAAFTAQPVSSQPGQQSLLYTATLPNGVRWERSYVLNKGRTLSVKDTLSNPSGEDLSLPGFGLSVGRAEPLRVRGHYQQTSNMYLGCGWLTADHFHLTTVSDFNPSSFFGLVRIRQAQDVLVSSKINFSGWAWLGFENYDTAPIRWIGAENQFFAVLLTPTADHLIDHAGFQCYNTRDASGNILSAAEPDIEATGFFPEVKIPAGGSVTFDYNLYAGTKDYSQLNALGEQQGELMNYGKFEILIVPMLSALRFFYSFLHNYGAAIILLTICIKIVTWPLQSVANRSGKRMQALAPKIKELQAKYKEQPEKLNTETFALYREYGVNPFKGCLPALIQMPIFFSLYYMLQNAGELRGQSFLWVHDLTQPDTIATWHGFALNPLPLLVTGLTMIMMRMTPQLGDPAQAKIAQFMPLIFLFIFYNFAAALSLYYVINNCVSIIQIYRNLRKPLPELKRISRPAPTALDARKLKR